MRATDGMVVFAEVRRRATADFGGAGSCIQATKPQRIVYGICCALLPDALAHVAAVPPCRFDVVLVEGGIEWLQAAFDVG